MKKLIFSGSSHKEGKAGSNYAAKARDLHDRREMPKTPHESFRGVGMKHPTKSHKESTEKLIGHVSYRAKALKKRAK